MKTIKGPAIFLAQFAGDASPFNNLKEISRWASSLGYKGVQIPTWDSRLFDLKEDLLHAQAPEGDDLLRAAEQPGEVQSASRRSVGLAVVGQ